MISFRRSIDCRSRLLYPGSTWKTCDTYALRCRKPVPRYHYWSLCQWHRTLEFPSVTGATYSETTRLSWKVSFDPTPSFINATWLCLFTACVKPALPRPLASILLTEYDIPLIFLASIGVTSKSGNCSALSLFWQGDTVDILG
jgi:hypothetical protein